jgi:putative endonuclease
MRDADTAYTVYIVRTDRGTLYVGQTHDLDKRLAQHAAKTGRGSKYLRAFTSFDLVYREPQPTLSAALKREAKLKRLTHRQKLDLIRAGGTAVARR